MKLPYQSRYTVRRGDTLEKIARHQYGTASVWREIARTNHLKRDRILVGMKLRMPVLSHHKTVPVHPANHPALHPGPVSQVPQSVSPVTPHTDLSPHAAHPPINKMLHSGDLPAVSLMFPAVKVKKSIALKPPVDTPLYRIEGELECECVFQRKGTMTEIEISEEGVMYSGKLSSDYDTAFSKLTADSTIKWDMLHPEKGLSLSSTLTVTNKFGDKEFNSTSFEPKPPNQFVYSMSPREVESETPDKQFTLKGKISFKITVTIKNQDNRKPVPQIETVPAYAPHPKRNMVPVYLVGGLLVVAAGVTIFLCPPSAIAWGELGSTVGLGAAGLAAAAP